MLAFNNSDPIKSIKDNVPKRGLRSVNSIFYFFFANIRFVDFK